MIAPIIDMIAHERTDLDVVKFNIDESSSTPSRLDIRSIPTLVLFKNGEIIKTITGATNKKHIEKELSEVL
jgi:thioredoxin 1